MNIGNSLQVCNLDLLQEIFFFPIFSYMFVNSLTLLLPIFFTAGGGYFLTKRFSLPVEIIIRAVTDFFMPILVFYSLAVSNMDGRTVLHLAGVTGFIVLVLFFFSFLYTKAAKLDGRTFIPPVIFMNSGFLGIPLMKLWGGLAAMNLIVVYDQVQTTLIFTLGILIVTGGFSAGGLKEMIKSPLLWAILAGFIWNFLPISFPKILTTTFRFAGNAATAVATFALGASLCGKKINFSIHLLAGILLRIVGGFLAGLAAVYIFRLEGTVKTVVLVASALPSAVFSFVLPERYGVNAEFAGTVVVISTVLGIVTIPLVFWLASIV